MASPQKPIPTPRYAAIVAAANRIASEKGQQHVGAEYLFLAIIRDRKAVPTQVLAQLVDLDQVEARLQTVMESDGYNTPSQRTELPGEG
jgi:ATP-dependent Clp protease ATP-binding subunit ClpA